MALINCPDCGSEVSDAAPACLKCGRPIAPPPPASVHVTAAAAPAKKNNHVSGFTTLVVFGLLGWFIYAKFNEVSPVSAASDHGTSEAESSPSAPRPLFATTARDLFNAYETNEVAADDAMRGKVVRVEGIIQAIDKDFSDDVVINLRTPNEFSPARMEMVEAEKPTAAGVHKGQSVVIDCEEMSRLVGSPSGRKCTFVREAQK